MSFKVFLIIGMIGVTIVILIAGKYYRLPIWKSLLTVLIMTALGVLGTKLMHFVEAGTFGGQSYYGAVFLIPILSPFVAVILKIRDNELLDVSSPCMMAMLVLMKVNCYLSGCCRGMIIRTYVNSSNDVVEIRFPSQIVEGVAAVLTCLLFLWFVRKSKFRGRLYPLLMVVYGGTRFILQFFRETKPFVLGMSAGTMWSLVSILIGTLLLIKAGTKKMPKRRSK